MTTRKKKDLQAGEFKGLTTFINRMRSASGNIGDVVERLSEQLPLLANTIGQEHEDIKTLTEILGRLRENNSKASALTGSMLEENEDLMAVNYEMRQLATISQLPPILAQTSPEFLRDVLTVADHEMIMDALKLLDLETYEKLLKALNSD